MTSSIDNIEKLFQMAVQHHVNGKLDVAHDLYQKVINHKSDHVEAIHNLGVIHLVRSENQKAIELFKRALSLNSSYVDALNNLATALKKEKNYQEAIETIDKILSLNPNLVQAYFNLGNLYREIGQYESAVDAFNRAISLDPNDYEAINNLSSILSLLGRYSDAHNACQKSLAIKPDQASAHYNIGTILMRERNHDEAIKAFYLALEAEPAFPDTYLNLGIIMQLKEQIPEAISCFNKAIKINPSHTDAYYNLGLAYDMNRDLDNEIIVQEAALKACPDSVQSWIGGVRAFSKIADWEHIDQLLSNIYHYDFSINENSLLSSSLFPLHSFPISDSMLLQKHCLWGDNILQELERLYPNINCDFVNLHQESGKKIRIGYVSPDFCRHSVGWFFKYIALNHDKTNFQLYCYSTDTREDDVTHEIETSVFKFKRVFSWNTIDIFKQIQKDQINILVDLAGHTKGNRLDVFALRPAPIQVTAIGYPNGTGLANMDYRITDCYAESGSSVLSYREKLVQLSNGFLPFGSLKSSDRSYTREDLGIPAKGVLLVSFNRSGKLRPKVLSLWDRLLTRCPEAILALGCGYIHRCDLRTNILSHFSSKRNKERIFFIKRAETEEIHRSRYLLADVALDTFPYAGTTSSYEALFMNVPVVTLVGDRHVQRTTYSFLKHLKITATIAHTEGEYLDKAAALIQNPKYLKKTKEKLSNAFQDLLRTQPKAYSGELEKAYQIMWARFLRKEPVSEILL